MIIEAQAINLPTSMKVGMYDYRIVDVEDLRGSDGTPLWGHALYNEQEIRLDNAFKSPLRRLNVFSTS